MLAALAGGAGGEACVELLEIFLELLLDLRLKGGEFNSHSNSRIASTHDTFCAELVRINPESDDYFGVDTERHKTLNVAPAAADISCTV